MKRVSRIRLLVAVLIIVSCCLHPVWAQVSPAEELMAGLPEDTLAAIATSGGHALQAPFEQSYLGKFCTDPGIKAFKQNLFNSAKSFILKQAAQDEPQAIEMKISQGQAILKKILEYPIAIGCGQNPANETLPVYLYAIFETAHDPAGFQDMLNRLYGLVGLNEQALTELTTQMEIGGNAFTVFVKDENDNFPGRLSYGKIGSRFMIALEPEPGFVATKLSGITGQPLKKKLSVCKGDNDLCMVYLNTADIRNFIYTLVEKEAKPGDFSKLKQIVSMLGLDQTGDMVSRSGFSGKSLVSDSSFEIRMTGTGLTGLLKPVDDSLLNYIDEKVMDVSLINIDLAHLYRTADQIIKTVASEADYQEFRNGLAEIETLTGINVEAFLKSVSGPMMVSSYSIGSIPEAFSGGIAAVIQLNDPVTFEKTMNTLGKLIQTKVAEENQQMTFLMIQDQEINGHVYHNWTIPPLAMAQVMPCWTIVKNRMVLASNAALCQITAEQISGDRAVEKPLVQSSKFKNATGKLPANLISLSYTDSRQMMRNMKDVLQMILPMASMGLSKEGISIPAVLPVIDHLIVDFEPMVSYSWMDANGVYSRSRGPIPASDGPVLIGGTAMGIGILMPALGRARETAKTVVCMNQLKQIGMASFIYANDHQGKFPPDLNALVREADLSPKVFICPATKDGPDDCSYVYRGADLDDSSSAMMILAYDRQGNHRDGNRNVLFADGHVQKMTEAAFIQAVNEDNEIRKNKNLAEKPAD